MFCTACGTEAPAAAKFCVGCGAPVTGNAAPAPAPAAAPPPSAETPRTSNKAIWIGIAVLLVGIVLAFVVLNSSSGTDSTSGTPVAAAAPPSTKVYALAQRDVAPGGDASLQPSAPAYGGTDKGNGEPVMRPADVALPPAPAAPPALAATKPAAEKKAAANTSTKGYYISSNLDASLNPDWKAFAAGDEKKTPFLQVTIPGKENPLMLIIAGIKCSEIDSLKTTLECNADPNYLDYSVGIDEGSGHFTKFFDCPDHRKPQNGCSAVWSDKGAAIIAAAKATK